MASPKVASLFADAGDYSAPEEAAPAPEGDADAKEMAAKRFFEAGKSGDYAGAAKAFKRMFELCEASYGDEE